MADDITLKIGAKDNASKTIDAIQKKADKLEEPVELTVEAKIGKAFDALDKTAAKMKQAATAAQALEKALGPDLADRMDPSKAVRDFQRMGLTLEEITANADKLGGKLKEIDAQGIGGKMAGNLGKAKQDVEGLGKSADSSKSALANMVGNTAQDVGALGGIAGSTGVAIGQMAEYMADAAFEGESLTAVAANFAKVAAPILLIGAAIAVFQGTLSSLKNDEKDAAQTTEELSSAFQQSHDWILASTQVLRDHSDDLDNYRSRITNLGEAIDSTFVGKVLSHIPAIGEHFRQATINVEDVLKSIGLTLDDVAQTTEGNVIFNKQFEQSLLDAKDAGKISEQQYRLLEDAVHSYQIEVQDAKKKQDDLNLSARTFHQTMQAITNQTHPLQQYTDLWDRLFTAIQSGNDAAAAALSNTLASLLGMDPANVVATAMGELDRRQQENIQTGKDWEKQQEENKKAADEFATALADVQAGLVELASPAKQAALSTDAISKAFTFKNDPLKVVEQVADIHDGMRDLASFIKKDLKGKIPNILDPNDINAGAFLQKIGSLRAPIQEQITEAFASGGPQAAQQTADKFVKELAGLLKGKMSAADIQKELGLDNLTATLSVAVDQRSLATATAMLELLTKLPNGDPRWTAEVQLALAAGELTPAGMEALMVRELGREGVKVPAKLQVDAAAGVAEANTFIQRHGEMKVTLPTATTQPTNTNINNTIAGTQTTVNKLPPVKIPAVLDPKSVIAKYPQFFPGLDQGGVAPGAGGIAGERGPEIINNRYLLTRPAVVPPGTRVTSRKRTEQILRTRGTRGLRRYDAGGLVAGPSMLQINVNAAVIGNRFDVMRAVQKAARDKQRLLGTRG